MAEAGALRAAAARAVAGVLSGRSLDDSLAPELAAVAIVDRPLLRELVSGACRWFQQLEVLANRLLQRPLKARERELQALLVIGIYQLQHTRIPAHAAVAESVAATRRLDKGWASGLVNAVLRRFQREGAALLQQLAAESPVVRYALPDWLLQRLQAAWPEDWERIALALLERPPMTLRVNLARIDRAALQESMRAAAIESEPLAGLPSALLLSQPVDVEKLPGFSAGLVSVQDAGAQLAAEYLRPADGERILDACAAPGGKTGHLLELAPRASLTALDVDAGRLLRVEQNLARLGLQARLLAGDAGRPGPEWGDAPFDAILADVPCSATGVIRRHPDIKLLRRAADIPALVARQAAILDALWGRLRPGGRLLYVTCSILPEENEQQVAAFLARTPDAGVESLPALLPAVTGLGLQLLPGATVADGFYYALLRKSTIS